MHSPLFSTPSVLIIFSLFIANTCFCVTRQNTAGSYFHFDPFIFSFMVSLFIGSVRYYSYIVSSKILSPLMSHSHVDIDTYRMRVGCHCARYHGIVVKQHIGLCPDGMISVIICTILLFIVGWYVIHTNYIDTIKCTQWCTGPTIIFQSGLQRNDPSNSPSGHHQIWKCCQR